MVMMETENKVMEEEESELFCFQWLVRWLRIGTLRSSQRVKEKKRFQRRHFLNDPRTNCGGSER
jgi:hypothetical protein